MQLRKKSELYFVLKFNDTQIQLMNIDFERFSNLIKFKCMSAKISSKGLKKKRKLWFKNQNQI